MPSVFDVARYVLNNAGPMATMKLQKLVYYCQAWSLAWDGLPLFEEDFQAWANGPVCPELFETYRGNFWLADNFYDNYNQHCFTDTEKETMNAVLDGYADKEPQWLSELTHKERPWRETRRGIKPGEFCNKKISKDLMQEYYGGLIDIEDK